LLRKVLYSEEANDPFARERVGVRTNSAGFDLILFPRERASSQKQLFFAKTSLSVCWLGMYCSIFAPLQIKKEY
jgi:hypothetical protein